MSGKELIGFYPRCPGVLANSEFLTDFIQAFGNSLPLYYRQLVTCHQRKPRRVIK